MREAALHRVCVWPRLAGADVLREIDAAVAGARPPSFAVPGRTAWLRLERPIDVVAAGARVRLRSVKLKGIGLGQPDGSYRPPSTAPFLRPNPHVGFDQRGGFVLVDSAPAPLGGITLRRAQLEFDNAAALFDGGCPSVAPIALYQFCDPALVFDDGSGPSPLAVVVTALPLAAPDRADRLLDSPPGVDATAAISRAVRAFGASLRRFHELGLFRFSACLDNYVHDEASDRAILVDLDSSLPLATRPPAERPLQVLRDVASGLFNLAAGLMSPRRIAAFPPADLDAHRPFLALAAGYYRDVSPALLDDVARAFEDWHRPIHRRVLAHRDDILSRPTPEARLAELRRHWMDRRQGYALLVTALREAHVRSAVAELAPGAPPREEMLRRAAAFTDERFARHLRERVAGATARLANHPPAGAAGAQETHP